MSHRIRPAALLLSAVLVAMALAAQPRALNPAYLAEMPPVLRVLREITGADPVDKAARQAGAFQQLHDIIEELSAPRAALGQFTPDENRILGEYRTARVAVMQSVEERHIPMLRRYDEDPALRDELLNRFFSPGLRSRSLSVSREMQRRIAILRQTSPAFGGPAPRAAAAPASAVATSAAPPVAAPAPAAPLPPDPSIAKARAAKVDTKVFGIQLGDRLQLPACNMMAMLGASTASCVMDGLMGEVATAFAEFAQGDTGGRFKIAVIKLAQGNCPSWMSNCIVAAMLDNGRLVSVAATPDGHSVQSKTSAELRAKYGRSFLAQERIITPSNGSGKFSVVDLYWQFPGLYVSYRVVEETTEQGRLIIETEEAHARRAAQVKEENRPKL